MYMPYVSYYVITQASKCLLHAQRVDHRHAQQRTVLDAFTQVDEALDDHPGERAAHGAQGQLRLRDAALFDPDPLLAAHLVELLLGQFELAARLFDGLVGDEALQRT